MSERTYIYRTMSDINVRVPNLAFSVPVDMDDRFELRRLLNQYEDALPQAEAARLASLIFGGDSLDKEIESEIDNLAEAFGEIVKAIVNEHAAKAQHEVASIRQKLEAIRDARQ